MSTALAAAPPAAGESWSALDKCDRLLAEHLADVVGRYGPGGLGVIDLPTLDSAQLVPAQIRITAVLYWASEVEQAGLLPMVEAISEGIVRGTFVQPLGGAVPELVRMWRTRERRFSAPERQALFSRIFGGAHGGDSAFPRAFRFLIAGLVEIGRARRDEGVGHLEARVGVMAQQLGGMLSTAGAGIAGFAARDVVAQIRGALQILRHPDVVRGLGGGSPWQLVTRHAPRLLGKHVRPERHVALGNAGLSIIGWIASEAPAIEAGTVRLGRTAQVIRSAEVWSAAYGDG